MILSIIIDTIKGHAQGNRMSFLQECIQDIYELGSNDKCKEVIEKIALHFWLKGKNYGFISTHFERSYLLYF